MAAATSSIRLLQAEIKREEAELAKDKLKLEELERNAKAAEAERKRLNKNVRAPTCCLLSTNVLADILTFLGSPCSEAT